MKGSICRTPSSMRASGDSAARGVLVRDTLRLLLVLSVPSGRWMGEVVIGSALPYIVLQQLMRYCRTLYMCRHFPTRAKHTIDFVRDATIAVCFVQDPSPVGAEDAAGDVAAVFAGSSTGPLPLTTFGGAFLGSG